MTEPNLRATPSRFSAAGPALGYLAQVDHALLAMLVRMDSEESFSTSIETFDDIVFHDAATDSPTEKWQSKHTIKTSRTMADSSDALWKTLRNWIVEPEPGDVRLVLLTTAPAGPVVSRLRPGVDRSATAALAGLERIALESKHLANQEHYKAFLALLPEERVALVDRIEVIDSAATAVAIDEELARAVRKSVTPARRPALVERLRGWWHARVIRHLDAIAGGRHDRITAEELEGELLQIADTLRDDNLPIDVLDLSEPTTEEVAEDDRIFVEQLQLIIMGSQRVRKCIYDHNRAFAQRSRWQRDRLLEVGELGKYDRELVEAWERFFLPLADDPPDLEEDELCERARECFGRLDQSDLVRIRRHVQAGFVARGSLHVIADRLDIGWHPRWLDHLRHRLGEVRDDSEETEETAA